MSGTQGAQGDVGPRGFMGINGSPGARGAQGPGIGSQGAQGFQGIAGSQGATGSGAQGATGFGAQGATGVQGVTGPQGIDGSQGATNLLLGSAGQIPYQSGTSTTLFTTTGTAGQVLISNETAAPTWSTNIAGNAGAATNVLGGLIGNVLYQSAPNVTASLVNGAAGRILTSGGVGGIPTWKNTFSGTATTATNAVNTEITNDFVSSATHALTFVSNTTGNLPQKTRGDMGTGEGLVYVPSTNTLTCRVAGVGTVSTNKVTLRDNLGETADILETGGALIVRNTSPGNPIDLQTADAETGTLVSRMSIDEVSIKAIAKVDTQAGIIGPTTSLTYASDMIGYVIRFNGDAATFTSGTQAGTLCTTTIGIGVWMAQTTQILVRGNGTYGVTSNTVSNLIVTPSSGTAIINNTGQGYLPIPNGHTGAQINLLNSFVLQVSVATTFTSNDVTNVTTVGTSTRQVRFMFTRIA
jgi:hypothetical protein